MEILSTEFLSALFAIIVIDLVLAGDNAIVIALAARELPPAMQRRAIVWGTAGAIAVRCLMTLVVVWLLKVPGLLFVGGALLVWVAYRLLVPEDATAQGKKAGHVGATSFWGAMQTIVIADALMGLDNVLAVAGAAHGSYLLVVLGLLISVPIVVWGSTLILRWVERFPAIVYVGAGVLAWTAASMMLAEPALKDWIDQQTLISPLTHFTVIGGVLWVGLRRNHRRLETRIAAHLKRLRAGPPHGTVDPVGEHTMLRLLVPIDGSANSGHAVRHVIKSFLSNPACEVHVLNVQAPLSRHIANVLRASDRSAWHRTRAEETLAPSVELLRQHGIPHAIHVRVGDAAHVIAAEAARLRCNRIVMATARKNSLTRMLQDSTTYRVLESTSIPVELVAGDAVSPLERWGVPAGIGALAAILLVAAD